MPYIDPKDRPKMDLVVNAMKNAGVEPNGKLNYVLFKFCKDTVVPSYNSYKNFIGELNECAAEIRRRFLSPYEDGKIEKNGDVDDLKQMKNKISMKKLLKEAKKKYHSLKFPNENTTCIDYLAAVVLQEIPQLREVKHVDIEKYAAQSKNLKEFIGCFKL